MAAASLFSVPLENRVIEGSFLCDKGGTAYDADGNYLGAFALPEPMPGDEPGATPHIFTDASGGIYVFDWTGNYHYQDLSVIPEPSTCALIVGSGAALLALSRRRRPRVS